MKIAIRRKEPESILTMREKKVLQLVGEANTNKEIAAAMGISPATVKRHMENILRKLQLKNRIEVALYSVGLGNCPLAIRAGSCPLITLATETESGGKNMIKSVAVAA